MIESISKVKSPEKISMAEINAEANRRLSVIYDGKGIFTCELRLLGCLKNRFIQFCHRHKRNWYKKKYQTSEEHISRLSDFRQTVRGCQNCHDKIEVNAKLTEEKFMELRGIE